MSNATEQRAIKFLKNNGGAVIASEFKMWTDKGWRDLPTPGGFIWRKRDEVLTDAGKALAKARPRAKWIIEAVA